MNFEQARSNMVLNQLRANRISNPNLIDQIENFPREALYPKSQQHLAYSDRIITLDDGRFILPPLTSFHLVQALGGIDNTKILEVGSGFGTTTSILSKFTQKIDCIETSKDMIASFQDSLKNNLFQANLLKNTIEDFFGNKKIELKKYDRILINGSIDKEPFEILEKAPNGMVLVCIVDNAEYKHKIMKYVKVDNNTTRFIVDEASSAYIFKYITKQPFVF